MALVLMYLCFVWPLIFNLATCEGDQNTCEHDEIAVQQAGRECNNKRCTIGGNNCKGRRQCVCDGVCGYRCIPTKATEYCQELQGPLNGFVSYSPEGRSFNANATYQCDPGYALSETVQRTCLGDGEWSTEDAPSCLPQNKTATEYCPELQGPSNGSVSYSAEDRSFNTSATYQCDPGYVLSETVQRTCIGGGEWSNEDTPSCLPQNKTVAADVCPRRVSGLQDRGGNKTCKKACTRRMDCPKKRIEDCLCDGDCGMSCLRVYVRGYCPDPDLGDGVVLLSIEPRGGSYKSVATLGCEEYYDKGEGLEEITCLLNRTWSGPPLTCTQKDVCKSPLSIEHAQHNSRKPFFYPGETLTYTCRAGYYGNGYGNGVDSTCQANLTWTPATLNCYPKSCGDPGYLRNGWREGSVFTFLSRVTFHCNRGYEMRGYPYRTCMSNQEWSSFMPECVAIECPRLYAPDHGTMQGTRFTYDSVIYFGCDHGYKLIGSETRRCLDSKNWSGEEATCRIITCPMPEAPPQGSRIAPRLGLNAIVRYSCNDGYTLEGSRTARCTSEETWSQPTPQCHGQCIVPEPPENGRYDWWSSIRPGQKVEHGTEIEILCDRWYSLNSEEPYVCNKGVWSFSAECAPTPCQWLPELHNGVITYEPEVNQSLPTIPHNTLASYSCQYGHEQQGGGNSPRCWHGSWLDNSVPVCQPKPCTHEDLRNGEVSYSKDSEAFNTRQEPPHHGVSRTFECGEGYSLIQVAAGESTCVDGEWSSALPTCEPDPCSALEIPEGNVEYAEGNINHKATAMLTCSRHLKPSVGNGHLKCHAGHWVPDGISCIARDAVFNVAYGKPAITSPDSAGEQAGLAVDGDRNTDHNHGSCTTARKSGDHLFWQVDLQDTYKIHHVEIYTSSKSKQKVKLTVKVGHSGSTAGLLCGNAVGQGSERGSQPIRVDCSPEPLYGQIVTIQPQRSGAEKMHLCEVEVYATGPFAICYIHFIPNLKVALEDKSDELPVNTKFPEGTIIDYHCDEGYQRKGPLSNLCRGDGTWAYADPWCEPARCKVPQPLYGELDQRISSIEHGMTVAYSCNDYYERLHEQIRCDLGELKPGPPRCVPGSCRLEASQFINVLINSEEPSQDESGKIVVPHATEMIFSCKRGFSMGNQNTQNLCWYGDLQNADGLPSCVPVPCPFPPTPAHGSYSLVQGDRLVHGTTVRFECDQGFILQPATAEYSTCENKIWSGSVRPVCEPVNTAAVNAPCPTPSVLQALIYYMGHNIATYNYEFIFEHGAEVEVRCVKGFGINGRRVYVATLTCLNGVWSPPSLRCEVVFGHSCPRPQDIEGVAQYVNGEMKLEDDSRHEFHPRTTLVSRCRDPLANRMMTEAIRTCRDGGWTGPEPSCEPASTKFIMPNRWSLMQQFFANGTLLIYPGVGELNIGCKVPKGYIPVLRDDHIRQWVSNFANGKNYGPPRESHSGTFTCGVFGQPGRHHTLHIQVRAVSCPVPSAPLNGRRLSDDFRITKKVSFECNEGYDLIGNQTIKCFLGKWLGEMPSCRATHCPELILDDPNLNVTNSGTSSGSRVAFMCKYGYRLVGDIILDCQEGSWSGSIPHCEAIPSAEPDTHRPLECGCKVWQRCILDANGLRTCGCIHPQQCSDVVLGEEPYCGSNGRTYSSLCRLKASACLFDEEIDVVSRGRCPEVTENPVQESALDGEFPSSEYSSESSLSSEGIEPSPNSSRHEGTATTNLPAGDIPSSTSSTHMTTVNNSIAYCENCTTTDLRTACQQATHVFVGRPKEVLQMQQNQLAYRVTVTESRTGLDHTTVNTNVTVVTQGFDELNHCHCPNITVGYEDYLFVLQQGDDSDDNSGVLFLSSGFVGLKVDFFEKFDESCNPQSVE